MCVPFLTSGDTRGIIPDYALEQALLLAARVASNEDCAESSSCAETIGGSFAKTYIRLVNLVYTYVVVENFTMSPEKWVFSALNRLPSIAPSAEYAGIVGGCYHTGLNVRALYNVESHGERFVAVLIEKNSFRNAREWCHMFIDMGMHLFGLEDGDHEFVCHKALFQQQIQDFDTRTTTAAFQYRSQGFYNIDKWDYEMDVAQPLVLPPVVPPSSFNFDTEVFSDDSSDTDM
mmetsp:Transcript_9607/g.24229  ORF Transcript_9607/g.24229 Transcript_9607/m.24229 type:complete len:232 (-) Transcript_9607:175-870(-)